MAATLDLTFKMTLNVDNRNGLVTSRNLFNKELLQSSEALCCISMWFFGHIEFDLYDDLESVCRFKKWLYHPEKPTKWGIAHICSSIVCLSVIFRFPYTLSPCFFWLCKVEWSHIFATLWLQYLIWPSRWPWILNLVSEMDLSPLKTYPKRYCTAL